MTQNTKQNLTENFPEDFNNELTNPEHGTPELNQQPETLLEHQKMKKRQNIALFTVAVVGIGVLLIATFQFRNMIQVPWPDFGDSGDSGYVEIANPVVNLSDLDSDILKTQDTDEDKLSDFDELNVYFTSPYLADSDSDGDNDYVEIMAGQDPNCPKGIDCFQSYTAEDSDQIDVSQMTAVEKDIYDVDAAEIRKVLLAAGGITQDQLDLVSDEELIAFSQQFLKDNPQVVEEAKKEKQTQGQTEIEQTSIPVSEQIDDQSLDSAVSSLNALTPSEVRQLLLEQGVDQSLIDQVDDATLLQLYSEALDQAKAQVE